MCKARMTTLKNSISTRQSVYEIEGKTIVNMILDSIQIHWSKTLPLLCNFQLTTKFYLVDDFFVKAELIEVAANSLILSFYQAN